MKRLFWLVLFALLLVFTRFYNIENTTRFIWDESSDLVRVHEIYVDRKLTLVGPISEDKAKVFGSLAYYLSMPFAIMGHFDPLSPVLGTTLGGLITGIGLLILARKLNPKISLILVGIIILTWFPLVQSSRSGLWAWHVSYIPMWLTLGVLLYLQASLLSISLAGLFLGLTIHHHYLSIFAVLSFSCAASIGFIRQRQWLKLLGLFTGLGLAILPFIIFDLRHPPGLFLTRMLYGSPIATKLTLVSTLQKFLWLTNDMFKFFTQSQIASRLLMLTVVLVLVWDVKHKTKAWLWSCAWLGQLLGLILITNDGVSTHYTLPAAVFFFSWMISPRWGKGKYLARFALLIVATSSLLNLWPQLTRTNWQTDIPTVRFMARTMILQMQSHDLKNTNLAVLASPDNNVYGRRYRDVLLISNVALRTKDEYQYSDHLFVVSVADEKTVRSDPAYEMHFFRQGPLLGKWSSPNSIWNLYLFNRNAH